MAKNSQKDEKANRQSTSPNAAQLNRLADTSGDDADIQMDHVRTMHAAGQKDDPRQLQSDIEKLDAATEEEVDALRVNLLQDDEPGTARDGSGRIVDDLAEQKIARFTEVGPLVGERGAVPLTPGRDDSSRILRRHYPNTEIARAEDAMAGNLEEPRNEGLIERKKNEGRRRS